MKIKKNQPMPFAMPTGTMGEIEKNVLSSLSADLAEPIDIPALRTAKKQRRRTVVRRMFIATSAAAAIVALAFFLHRPETPQPACTLNDVEEAYSQLSQADQALILSTYSEDVFLTPEDDSMLSDGKK